MLQVRLDVKAKTKEGIVKHLREEKIDIPQQKKDQVEMNALGRHQFLTLSCY